MSSRFYGIMTNCLENAENTVNVLAPDQCELGQSMRKKLYELQLLLLLTDERKNVAYEQCLLMRMMKQQKICQGRAACEYNELEWSRFAGLPAFMSIKNWRRIYTDNQEQSSLFLAMKNGRKSLERQKADQRRQATMAGFQPFFALFLFLCLSLAIAQLIKSLPSGRTSSWCLPFAFMHIKLAENLMLCWRKVTSVHQRLR